VSTEFGESFAGEGVDAAHVNTVLGAVGGPVETAWVTVCEGLVRHPEFHFY